MRNVVAVAAVTAVAGAAVLAAAWRGDEDDGDIDELPVVGSAEVVAIFKKLVEVMNLTMRQAVARINQQGNGQIPQAMLQQYLLEQFEATLKEVQGQIFKQQGHSEEDVEEAVSYYEQQGDAAVVKAVNELRLLYMNFGGAIDLDLPEDLDINKMCQVFEEYMAAVVEAQQAFTTYLQQLKAKGAQVTSVQLQEIRQSKIDAHGGAVLAKFNLNFLMFQIAIEKYNNHPQFLAKIAAVKAGDAGKAKAAAAAGGRA